MCHIMYYHIIYYVSFYDSIKTVINISITYTTQQVLQVVLN